MRVTWGCGRVVAVGGTAIFAAADSWVRVSSHFFVLSNGFNSFNIRFLIGNRGRGNGMSLGGDTK